MPSTPHIAWIAGWYPHEGDPYAGDFIRRHAQAVAAFLPLTVYSCFDHPSATKKVVSKEGNLTEVIVYIKSFKTGIRVVDKAIFWARWFHALKNRLTAHQKAQGLPELLHCHIILNAGWLGLWAKKKWKIPFIVTEHWAGYMPGAVNGFEAYNSWSKRKFRQIVRDAAMVTGVSEALIRELRKLEPHGNYRRIANVVNEDIFHYQPGVARDQRLVFIHISTLSAQKNLGGIIDSIHLCRKYHPKVLLKIAGPENIDLQRLITNYKLEGHICWLPEMPQEDLVLEIRECLALILFSRYESFGCVVIEANAAGVPAVVSDIAPMKELVKHGYNGLIARGGSSSSLAENLAIIIEKKIAFDPAAISRHTLDQFSYPVIGRQIVGLYHGVLKT